jgi:hypothetical protein
MYKEDTRFEKPENDKVKIWRYMDFHKLVWMLAHKCLYFCTVDKIREKDSFEGSYQPNELLQNIPLEQTKELRKKIESCGFPLTVNCWHLNEYESAAMWNIYTIAHKGVAVQSTFGQLVKALNEFPDDVYIGKIKYIDYQTDKFAGEWPIDIFEPVLTKRKSFEHEKELRAVIWETSENTIRTDDGSVLANINIRELIENIYISPFSPNWYRDNIQIIIEKFDLEVPVRQSDLNKEPIY